MAFDGIVLRRVINELDDLKGARVDKIFEPTENSIVLGIYNGDNLMINIDVSAVNYRLHLSTHKKKNPDEAPNFCMLLRKYLIGSKINAIYQKGLERICYIEFEALDQLVEDKVTYTLAIELMGKYSNIVLLNKDFVIIDALKRFGGNVNAEDERIILSGKPYIVPENSKQDITKVNVQEFINSIIDRKGEYFDHTDEYVLRELVSNQYTGISTQSMDEILMKLHLSNTVNENSLKEIYEYIISIVENNEKDENGNKVTEFPYGFNFYLDDLYYEKTEKELFTQYRNKVLKVLDGTLSKLTRKLNNINKKIEDSSDMDKCKLYGELIEANIYKYASGYPDSDVLELENYYDENKIEKIAVNPQITLVENAQKYFKKYTKFKNTVKVVEEQKKETERELKYLEGLIYKLDRAKDVQDVDEVYEEISENILYNVGINAKSNKQKNGNSKNKGKNKYDFQEITNLTKLEFDGYTIYVGKNNKQNDYLTCKFAKDKDIWFHTKDIHGSHVILKTNGDTPPKEVIIKCAELASYYSKAKYSSHVPVDYTEIKNVKKPNGAPLGYVIYTNNKTVYVDPKV